MHRSLSSLVPNVADLLSLEVEELADVLLLYLNDNNSQFTHQGGINYNNFFYAPARRDYENRQPEVDIALMEALGWLRSAGLLVEQASLTGGFFFVHGGESKSRPATILQPIAKQASCQKASFTPSSPAKYIRPFCAANMTPPSFRPSGK